MGVKKTILVVMLLVAMRPVTTDARQQENLSIETGSIPIQFQVEIADDNAERAQGLMFRKSLDPRHGMLFLYPRSQQIYMWMKNTEISLDMIFIQSDGIIRNIARQTTPHSLDTIASNGEVLAVLEINGGLSDELGIKAGQKVHHPAFDP